MSYKIVFFDIDGTLVNEQKLVPADTVKAIKELQETGVEAVIATGRAPYFFGPLAQELGINSFVSLNGAYVVYQGKPLYKNPIPRSSLEALVAYSSEKNHSLVFEGSEAFFANSESHVFVEDSVLSLRVELPGYDPDFWKKEDIYQVFLHCEAHEEHLYEPKFPDLKLIRWHEKAMDVLPAGGSKAKGIEAMLKMLGIQPHEAVAFGDGLNDKEMLEYVGLGIAMGNSHKELLPFADYVTASVDEGGIRQGLHYAHLIHA
ncbi:Cof-type HAD-IIB family hydrolase [Paenibacillus hexagrammi]|uniref:Cof-type HAD-IIB family hydrolase n=1 Tax=Paenibacillus hexagrammi TaxID=2908839 RepID=A0ABY3SCM1_9BACL|nr:Cof-type HAD-IIB family hydrolase [Paenibacillus sp. YPD9-1]UJF31691.1 Cof-type HAD-IIB family hydrolase [Paenibacillus sp. YPD9-1]